VKEEPGMGMIPGPRQIGDGDGSGPPIIPGKSGTGMGVDPRSPASRRGIGGPSPIPGKSGMGMGMGIGDSVPSVDHLGL
jgi:hypothetical protein